MGGGGSMCRRRSFLLTNRGLVNEGDEVVVTSSFSSFPSSSLGGGGGGGMPEAPESGSGASRSRSSSSPSAAVAHRVLVLGGPGVGKTAIVQQFLTSEYMAAQNTSFDDGREIRVPVLLDGRESILEFIDLPYSGKERPVVGNTYSAVDGYIIVYAITDRRSFCKATDSLREVVMATSNRRRPIILVANKTDLERSRIISKDEGRNLAQSNDCKYIEVSAVLNHKIDDLLVGILKQMRKYSDTYIDASIPPPAPLPPPPSAKRSFHLVSPPPAGRTPPAALGEKRPSSACPNSSYSSSSSSSPVAPIGVVAQTWLNGKTSSSVWSANSLISRLFSAVRKTQSKSCEDLLT